MTRIFLLLLVSFIVFQYPALGDNSRADVIAQSNYDINIFDMFYLTPSFSPGIYEKGKSKDLDFFLEFKTQVELSIKTNDNSRIGIGFSHISNGRLSLINPGVESLTFTFIFPM